MRMIGVVNWATRELTDDEIVRLNIHVQLHGDDTVAVVLPEIFEKVKPLFTEQGRTRMHGEIIEALNIVAGNRAQKAMDEEGRNVGVQET